MDPISNPYAPGAGRPPAALAGREEPLDAWRLGLARLAAGRSAQSQVLHGLRGVGKTVLLARFAEEARARGWLVAGVEARSGRPLGTLLGEAFHDLLQGLDRPGVGERVLRALRTAQSFKASVDSAGTWSLGVDLTADPAAGSPAPRAEQGVDRLLRDLAAAAEEEGAGVAVLVDEAQDLTAEELVTLCSAVHQATQRQERVLVALAGLPSLPRRLAEAKSYAERLFEFRQLGPLSADAARAALIEPAGELGVAWDEAALTHVVTAAEGYAYFLQQYGQDTWNCAEAAPITLADARTGVTVGRRTLDRGFFQVRWERTTPTEKHFLRAMAVDGGAATAMRELAERLGRPVRSLAATRAQLQGKGLVFTPDYGVVAFTVPGMAGFVQSQPEES